MNINTYLTLVVVAFVMSVVSLPLLSRLALGAGWVDAPNERKAHEGIIPLTGGLTVALSVIVTLGVAAAMWPMTFRPMIGLGNGSGASWPLQLAGLAGGLVACFLIGLWDDRFPLRARYRLLAQVSAALFVVLAGTSLTLLGTTFFPMPVGLWILGGPVTIVALTGLINAYNMSDGLDGLCGGYSLIALVALALCAVLVDRDAAGQARAFADLAPAILPFLGAVAGFLVYNLRHPWRERAASFLGDGGSMSLGFLIGWLSVQLASGYDTSSIPPVTALWIVALPLIDMFSCMIRRPLEGKMPMSADRRHLHHLLMSRGLSVRQAVWTLHAIAAAMALIGIASWRLQVPAYWLFWLLVAGFVAYTLYAIRYWRKCDGLASTTSTLDTASVPE